MGFQKREQRGLFGFQAVLALAAVGFKAAGQGPGGVRIDHSRMDIAFAADGDGGAEALRDFRDARFYDAFGGRL